MKQNSTIWICLVLSLASAVAGWAQEKAVPVDFDYIGSYLLDKRVKLRDGETFEVPMKKIEYRVYTDGIKIYLYGGAEEVGHTAYEIYRSDGILEAPDKRTIETVAGIQAYSVTGSVLRGLTLTQRGLTMTTQPAVSGVVEVIYASRVKKKFLSQQIRNEEGL